MQIFIYFHHKNVQALVIAQKVIQFFQKKGITIITESFLASSLETIPHTSYQPDPNDAAVVKCFAPSEYPLLLGAKK